MNSINQEQVLDTLSNILNTNSNINGILANIEKDIENIESGLTTLESANGKDASEKHYNKFIQKITGNTGEEKTVKIWDTWVVKGYSDLKEKISQIKTIKSTIIELMEGLDLDTVEGEYSLELIGQYNLSIDALLAAGIEIPPELLQKIFLETELSNKITSDEYRADNEDWDGIKDKNIQYWTDKPLKFVKDPNNLGTNAYLVYQQDENGNWIGMGFTDEKTVLTYTSLFGETLQSSKEAEETEEIKNIDSNKSYSKDEMLLQKAKQEEIAKKIGFLTASGAIAQDAKSYTYDEETGAYKIVYDPTKRNIGLISKAVNSDGSWGVELDPTKRDDGLIFKAVNSDGSWSMEFDPTKRDDGRISEVHNGDGNWSRDFAGRKDGLYHTDHFADKSYTQYFKDSNGNSYIVQYDSDGNLIN